MYRYNMNNINYSQKNNSSNNIDMCECGFENNSVFPENYMYAQSYVPVQTMNTVFKADVGLKMGTMFPELVSPYMPNQDLEEINYLKNSNVIKEGCNSGM